MAALGSWLDARKNQGKWLLRIEDIDTPRCIAGADDAIRRQLLACGLYWDEEPTWQSCHLERYQKALERLHTLHLIYACTCSRQMIASALGALKAQDVTTPRNHEVIYPGTCRPQGGMVHRPMNDALPDAAWRLALPQDLLIEFKDIALGNQAQCLSSEVGDFVLRRRDGLFTYQLAVVVDDAEQGISHVVRGHDLLSNTGRQIHLHNLLGLKTPQYLHLPLVLDANGEKLSKQTLATAIQTQDKGQVLTELRKAANHLTDFGLRNLPDQEDVSIAEWLLAATRAWNRHGNLTSF